MYFTSGAKVSTRRSRRAGSPERWYCFQRVSVCSELRRFVDVAMLGVTPEGGERGTRHLSGLCPDPLIAIEQMLSLWSIAGRTAQAGSVPADHTGVTHPLL